MLITSKICELVNNQSKPNWWRFTVSKAMECGELSSVELDQAYLIAKMEFGLEKKCTDYTSLIKPVQGTGYHEEIEEIEEIRLVSIGNTSNISTLAAQKKN